MTTLMTIYKLTGASCALSCVDFIISILKSHNDTRTIIVQHFACKKLKTYKIDQAVLYTISATIVLIYFYHED